MGLTALAQEQSTAAADNNNTADTYPHISALENAILGQSFPGQPLTERLGRMEKKVFGSASTNPDLSERTDALDEYTDKQMHKKLLQAAMDVEASSPEEVLSSSNQTDYPHVTALEQTILGQTFAGQPLADRLSRMEIKAFGKASNSSDLSARTDALETYAEKTLHVHPSTITEDNTTNTGSQKGGLFSKVGQALFGMAAPNMNGIGGTFGRGGGLGYGGGGLGGSGMGFGPMGNFGGGGMRRQQSPQQQEPEKPAPKPEDPAVYAPAPPDASARLIIKVGWCEVKVFGHTFANMHLPERLGQLNHELNFEPGKSNIQLMDDIGLMIKTVQTRKPAIPVSQP